MAAVSRSCRRPAASRLPAATPADTVANFIFDGGEVTAALANCRLSAPATLGHPERWPRVAGAEGERRICCRSDVYRWRCER